MYPCHKPNPRVLLSRRNTTRAHTRPNKMNNDKERGETPELSSLGSLYKICNNPKRLYIYIYKYIRRVLQRLGIRAQRGRLNEPCRRWRTFWLLLSGKSTSKSILIFLANRLLSAWAQCFTRRPRSAS